MFHRNARLGLAGRRALVADVESGCSCREAARGRGVSPTTACKWWRRWSEATAEQRRSLGCLEDRSSRPHRSPRPETIVAVMGGIPTGRFTTPEEVVLLLASERTADVPSSLRGSAWQVQRCISSRRLLSLPRASC